MVKSKHCTTYNMPSNMLLKINEDPLSPGGYIIHNGKELVIIVTENMKTDSSITDHPRKVMRMGK